MSDVLLETVRPTESRRVMDLVEAAGHDVSDWANHGGAHPATNPKYCYEWCFAQLGRATIVCLWFENLRNHRNTLTTVIEIDESAFVGPRRKRILRLRDGLIQAHADDAPLRVIVLEGKQFPDNDQKQSVDRRRLDPVPWHVANCDPSSGTFHLQRGPGVLTYFDQFDAGAMGDTPTQREIAGKVFDRCPQLRRDALVRAAGRCEFCGDLGFVTPEGRIFLETHHVIPLGEGGSDQADNIVALCANHHREAHHGVRAHQIRKEMQNLLHGATKRTPYVAAGQQQATAVVGLPPFVGRTTS